MRVKLCFFEIILKIYPTKRENAVEALNCISFVTWAVLKNPKSRVLFISLARKMIKLNFCYSLLFANWAKNQNNWPQNYGTLIYFEKKWKINTKSSFGIRQKLKLHSAVWEKISVVQLWISAVSEKISAEKALFLTSEIFRFQRCLELNQRCSEILR